MHSSFPSNFLEQNSSAPVLYMTDPMCIHDATDSETNETTCGLTLLTKSSPRTHTETIGGLLAYDMRCKDPETAGGLSPHRKDSETTAESDWSADHIYLTDSEPADRLVEDDVLLTVTSLAGTAFDLAASRDETFPRFVSRLAKFVDKDPWQLMLLHDATMLEGCQNLSALLHCGEPATHYNLTLLVRKEPSDEVCRNSHAIMRFLRACAPRPFFFYYSALPPRPSAQTRDGGVSGHGAKHTRSERKRNDAKRKKTERRRRSMRKPKPKEAQLTPKGPKPKGHWEYVWGGPCMERAFVENASVKKRGSSHHRPMHRYSRHTVRIWQPQQTICEKMVPESVREGVKKGLVQLHCGDSGVNLMHMVLSMLRGPALSELTQLLLQGGGRVDACYRGKQLLHVACSRGRGEVALLLLHHRADPTAVDNKGMTPLQYALEYFHDTPNDPCLEEMALVQACCLMLDSEAKRDDSLKRPTTLASVRLHLSRVATELSLLSPFGAIVTREAVIQKSSISRDVLGSLGHCLWDGWPTAFMRLDCAFQGLSSGRIFEPNFVCVRLRILKLYSQIDFGSNKLHASWGPGRSASTKCVDASIAKQSLFKVTPANPRLDMDVGSSVFICSADVPADGGCQGSSWTRVAKKRRKPCVSAMPDPSYNTYTHAWCTLDDFYGLACNCDYSTLGYGQSTLDYQDSQKTTRDYQKSFVNKNARRIRRLPWKVWECRHASRSSRLARKMPHCREKFHRAWEQCCGRRSGFGKLTGWKEDAAEALDDLRM